MLTADKGYHITTFGCQMNAHDSEMLAGTLEAMGYRRKGLDDADVVVFNTCCIRENAENKVYGHLSHLKHLKKDRPGLIVAVGGCMPQQSGARRKLMDSGVADIVFGTHNLHRFAELLQRRLATGDAVEDVETDAAGLPVYDNPAVRETRWRSGVSIMYGCDNFCSYCVVPYVRGRERSRPVNDILTEISGLVADGVKEVMLLGQNVNSYGQKPVPQGTDFPGLLTAIAALDKPPERIRFMTSHPKDLSPGLIAAVRDLELVCKHVHLPVQSGSSRILRLMNRGYDRETYLSALSALRAAVPGIAVTTDIIVGFPGETEEDFEETLTLAEAARFSGAFTFIYSAREGTKAASMDGHVPPDVISRRFQRLVNVLNPICLEINKNLIGQTLEVLIDKYENGNYTGRADNNALVHFTSGTPLTLGAFVNVTITDVKTFFLLGRA